ncbi:hypothetical protein [Haloechinothrix sp. LS1_15]|uniref:hypothetical protein n=1 Tax=Haloechinothrix sp. LS1_15 TaxID=2652248 RepID=UPI00294608A4|nr:hypothetical protein [Haloechinothrix sp. LS1_15]MDV6014600.1 hypothetical protein [Haloechinothrix sp. LS1_15]
MTARYGSAHRPWRDGDVVMVCLSAVGGVVAIAIAWYGADRSAVLHHATGWLNLAVAGFAVTAIGIALWLLRGRRAVGERRTTLVSLDPGETEPAGEASRPAVDDTPELVRAVGMQRVHRPECPLVAGKQLETVDQEDGQACGVCLV